MEPRPGERFLVGGTVVTVESCRRTASGFDLIIRGADGLQDWSASDEDIDRARIPANDGRGSSREGLAGLWGQWMQYASPRLRSGALATRPLRPFHHQDEAVFDAMLSQPRLRFLLADEPGTGKTIMTGMYLAEARRRGLIPGRSVVIVPAHLVQKWLEELEDFFGIVGRRLTPEIARDPYDLHPSIDVWVASLDLFTHNADVRRKIAGPRESWSLAVFDEAHRLTPTARYLTAAQELAARSHHLLLLTATPHRGKEDYFRALCSLLDPQLYPWSPGAETYEARLKPSKLSFLRRMKEDLRDLDGSRLFPNRFSKTESVALADLEQAAYSEVMAYADRWYGEDSTLALSIYGKRAASSLYAARCTLGRRRKALLGSSSMRGIGHVPEMIAEAFRGDRPFSEAFDDPDQLEQAEHALVSAATKNKPDEIRSVEAVLDQLDAAMSQGGTPSKWVRLREILRKHEIRPGIGQLLVFTEFADTALWLNRQFAATGFSVETLEGKVNHAARHALQRRFLDGSFQVLVSTDAGGEGINLQSAHVMIDWDIPWSLVRLEQRMGRLHRIGQKNDVYVYHLVAPSTREGRVQEVVLRNIEEASASLGGRLFDLLDATAEKAGFDFASALSQAQSTVAGEPQIPTVPMLTKIAQELAAEDSHLRSKPDHIAADARFRADRIEAINPVIVDGFFDVVAEARGWTTMAGPSPGIRLVKSQHQLPAALGAGHQRYVAAYSGTVQQALADGASGLEDVTVLGPTEDAFTELVLLAVETGRPELLRGCRLIDTGSITDYALLVFEAEVRMHDGVRQVSRPAPILVRWSGAGAFEVSWESLMSLRAAVGAATEKPSPGQLADCEAEARRAVSREAERQREERAGWVKRAQRQLIDLENTVLAETSNLPSNERLARQAAFQSEKTRRLYELSQLAEVQPTAVRLAGWAHVSAGVTLDQLGYQPDAEKTAVATVIAELEQLGYVVDDRQTAGVGYDLLARHKQSGDQRCVEVKGFTAEMNAIWLEQNEWAQALQRGDDYWLYVVDHCQTAPVVRVRTKDPAYVFGSGTRKIQRFRVNLSQLKEQSVSRD